MNFMERPFLTFHLVTLEGTTEEESKFAVSYENLKASVDLSHILEKNTSKNVVVLTITESLKICHS